MNSRSPESFTLSEIQQMRFLNPQWAEFADFLLVDDTDSFNTLLLKHIDDWIAFVEEDPQTREKDSEDRTTLELVGFLRAKGYDVSHDEKVGGHADIVVRHRKGFMWLGEAKKHSSYTTLYQGFEQLSSRYSPGTFVSDKGGLLIYIRNEDAADVVHKWRENIKSRNLPDYSDQDCIVRKNLAFFSKHKHQRSGLPYTVRHMGVVLHFDPKDKK